MVTEDLDKICRFCGKLLNKNIHIIDEIYIVSNDDIEVIRIDKFKELLDNWASKKYYHLSATELILLRPDIVTNFIREYIQDKDAVWFGRPLLICDQCYNDIWIKLYPIK